MDDLAEGLARDTELVRSLVDHTGLTRAALAKGAGVAVTTINRPFNGTSPSRLGRSVLEKLQRAYPDFPGWASQLPPAGVADPKLPFHGKKVALDPDPGDTVEIATIDSGYGLGGTFIDENALTVEKRQFSRAWLRQYTNSPPDLLFITTGIGDSMYPTINDSDGILVDRGDNRLRGGDRLWAISYAGTEMIKRLRPRPDGTVVILSDNPNVSDDVAADGELFIVGRVAAIVRKV